MEPNQPDFLFFWRSDEDPFSDPKNAKWTAYDPLLSLRIEEAYQRYMSKKGPAEMIINERYKLNFQLMNQICIQQEYKRRPIKREEIGHQFFWRSDPNPFSSPSNAQWTPYDMGDTLFLEDSYQNFLNKGVAEVVLGEQYKVNFPKMMQISQMNQNNQRPIRRDLPKNVLNIVRRDRFDLTYHQKGFL